MAFRDSGASILSDAQGSLLLRLMNGQVRLRRFPSGQWSISGNRFIASKGPDRLQQLGFLELIATGKTGAQLYGPTVAATVAFGPLAEAFARAEGASHERKRCVPSDTGSGHAVDADQELRPR